MPVPRRNGLVLVCALGSYYVVCQHVSLFDTRMIRHLGIVLSRNLGLCWVQPLLIKLLVRRSLARE